ncbi:MAG: hypothetical protein HOV79_00200 [Hamadaea sp.]|nr:hypothetical protein [Hamadaea sp.]
MTDPWATKVDAKPPRQGISPAMIAVIATSVAVLAIVGATGGYLLANANPEASSSPSAGPTGTAATSPASSVSPSPFVDESPSTAPSGPATSFALPAGEGGDFKAYFAQLRSMKLGVVLVFGQEGQADGLVTQTQPAAGASVHAGITVKVYVAGPAPETTVPTVVGLPCREARIPLGAAGLFPAYVAGQSGVVLRQSPDPQTGGTARWNDKVEISCGASPFPTLSR